MKCEQFRHSLLPLLRDELSAVQREACESHLAECADCLLRWQAELADMTLPMTPDASRLSAGILHGMGMDSCQHCEDLLGDFVDEQLPEPDAGYMAAHLKDCAQCQSLAAAMRDLAPVLSGLANMDPDSRLTDAILRHTSEAPERTLSSRLTDWDPGDMLGRLLVRPRIALEASFSLTVVWALLFGLPDSSSTAIEIANQQMVEVITVPQRLSQSPLDWNRQAEALPALMQQGWRSLADSTDEFVEQGRSRVRDRREESHALLLSWLDRISGAPIGVREDN